MVSDQALFRDYRRYGDLRAREQLVERFLPLAKRLADRYENSSEPLDDLVQVASLALVKAIDRFDSERGHDFASYAVPTILGELRRHFRDFSWRVHVTRGEQERVLVVSKAIEKLSAELGRSPRPAEVARRLAMPVEKVLAAMEAGNAYSTLSLEAPLNPSGDTLGDSLGRSDDRFERIEYRAAAEQAVRALPPRERTIVYLRFAEGLSQREIGARIGLSQMHVSRLLRRAIDRMRIVTEATA
jgi:RNA polymerase sigma-B factor